MKLVKKSLIVGSILGAIGAGAFTTIGVVSAESGTANADGSPSSLVEKIASKFNLNKADVQKVFDEDHASRQAEHDQRVANKLQKLVDSGAITAAQKTAIEAKLKELQASREQDKPMLKNLSADERQSKMEEKKKELENWAQGQGLDLSQLKGIFGGRPGGSDKN